jgi:hypothetical protein
MPKNKMISEMGADKSDMYPNETTIPMTEKEIQDHMGFTTTENVHGKSTVTQLPEHPRKEG